MHILNYIESKSSTLYLGLDLKRFDHYRLNKKNTPIILWNHRWEYDKNPKTFFRLLNKLKNNNINFKIVILGENFSETPYDFKKNISVLNDRILHHGFAESFRDYASWVWKSNIIPVTNIQDFFGGSIVEAVYCQCIPVLPNRLTYPEIFSKENLYKDEIELYENTINAIDYIKSGNKNYHKSDILRFDWSNMYTIYDTEMEKVLNKKQ